MARAGGGGGNSESIMKLVFLKNDEPLKQAHEAFLNFINPDLREEVRKKIDDSWNKNMAGYKFGESKLNETTLDHFFQFAREADPGLSGFWFSFIPLLKFYNHKAHQSFEEIIKEKDFEAFKDLVEVVIIDINGYNMKYNNSDIDSLIFATTQIHGRLLKIAGIYGIGISEVNPRYFDHFYGTVFATKAANKVLKLFPGSSWAQASNDIYNYFIDLLRSISFSYQGENGKTSFISFMTFQSFTPAIPSQFPSYLDPGFYMATPPQEVIFFQ